MKRFIYLSIILIITTCSYNTGLGSFIDKAPPTVKGDIYSNSTRPLWQWDGNSNIDLYRVSLDNGDWQETKNTSYTPEYDLKEGVHTLSVQGRYQKVWSESSIFTITIDLGIPEVNAGRDEIIIGSVAYLNGSCSDSLSGIKSAEWIVTASPGQYKVEDAGKLSTTITSDVKGDFFITLKVSDNAGNTAEDKLTISFLTKSEIYVNCNYTDLSSDGSIAKPYKSIVEALGIISDPLIDTTANKTNIYNIKVAAGTYTGKVKLKNLVFMEGGYNSDFTENNRENYPVRINISDATGDEKNPASLLYIGSNVTRSVIKGIDFIAPSNGVYTAALFIDGGSCEIYSCRINGGFGWVTNGVIVSGSGKVLVHDNLIHGGTGSDCSTGIRIMKGANPSINIVNNNIFTGSSPLCTEGINNAGLSKVFVVNNIISSLPSTSSEYSYSIKGIADMRYNNISVNNNKSLSVAGENWNLSESIILGDTIVPESGIPIITRRWGVNISYIAELYFDADFYGNKRTDNYGIGWSVGAVEYDDSETIKWNSINLDITDNDIVDFKSVGGSETKIVYTATVNNKSILSLNYLNNMSSWNSVELQAIDNSTNADNFDIDLYNGAIFVAYKNAEYSSVTVKKGTWDGSNISWIDYEVLNCNIKSGSELSLKIIGGTPVVAFCDANDNVVTYAYFYDSNTKMTSWVLVSAELFGTGAFSGLQLVIDKLGNLYLGVYSVSEKVYMVAKNTDGIWGFIGDNSLFSCEKVLTGDNVEFFAGSQSLYLSFIEDTGKAVLYKYDGLWEMLSRFDNQVLKMDIDVVTDIPILISQNDNHTVTTCYYNGFYYSWLNDLDVTCKDIDLISVGNNVMMQLFNDNGGIKSYLLY